MKEEIIRKGRLPHMLAPDAVKNVVAPTQNAKKPMIRLDARSIETPYVATMTWRPGVTMGPSAVVTPEANARINMIDSFHVRDQFSGSLGSSDGCGWSMISPSRFNEESSILFSESLAPMVYVPGGAAIWTSSNTPRPILRKIRG